MVEATMLRASIALVLASVALACARGGSEAADGSSKAGSRPDPQQGSREGDGKHDSVLEPATWAEPGRTHLLLLGHTPELADARLLPIALRELATNAPPSPSAIRTLPALEHESWPGHTAMVVAHGGGERWAAAQGRPGTWTVQTFGVDPAVPASLELPIGEVIPAAMHQVGDHLFIGQGDTVAFIDLAATSPARTELRKRPEMRFKAYDLFVRSGAWLIAIDDQVFPIYADGFSLDRAAPRHVQDWELPGAINGHYYDGVLIPSGPADGVLYVLLAYGIRTGNGHNLAALPIRAGKLDVDEGLILNNADGKSPPVLEEHVDRGTHKPTHLIAGSEYSEWTRLEYLPDGVAGEARLLLAAGPRGLLELSPNFGPDSKADMLELGGEAWDLRVVDGKIWALVSPSDPTTTSELIEVVLEARGGGRVERRIALPGRFHRIVR